MKEIAEVTMKLENKANELAAKVSSLICDLDIKEDINRILEAPTEFVSFDIKITN